MATQPPREKDPNEIGVLWEKKTAKGGTWFSGVIDDRRVVVFWTRKKPGSKGPDYQVLLARDAEGRDSTD